MYSREYLKTLLRDLQRHHAEKTNTDPDSSIAVTSTIGNKTTKTQIKEKKVESEFEKDQAIAITTSLGKNKNAKTNDVTVDHRLNLLSAPKQSSIMGPSNLPTEDDFNNALYLSLSPNR